jgi:hypothetical protein
MVGGAMAGGAIGTTGGLGGPERYDELESLLENESNGKQYQH